jgi:hypothetical protein
MRSKVRPIQQLPAFERVLEAMGQELIESTDEELLEAARELGMDPTMRGSAAFIGLKYPAMPRLQEFFELAATHPLGIHTDLPAAPRSRARPYLPKRRGKPTGGGGEGT